jgi:exonuclease SbcD
VNFYLLPFIKPPYIRRLFENGEEPKTYEDAVRALLQRETLNTDERNVLVAHQFFTAAGASVATCDSEILQVGGLDQVDVAALDVFDYGAFGHIHGSQSVGAGRFRYSGSPLKYSVSEAGHKKALWMVELQEKGTEPVLTEMALSPLHDVRTMRGTLSEILAKADDRPQDYVSITLTDEVEQSDAAERLMDVYPNLLEVRVDNARTRQQLSESFQTEIFLSPEEIFAGFFEGIQGRTMTQEEEKIIRSVIDRSREEGSE